MKEKKVASLKIVFEDGSDYSVACEKGLDKDELANYIERAFKPEPAEPLIKDEKVRKAVRAWAEAADTEYLAFEDYDDENVYFIDRDFEPQIWFPKKSILGSPLDDGKIYTIAELCGEEEESRPVIVNGVKYDSLRIILSRERRKNESKR